ncbi:MAG: formate/nitrite transporter family protein [Lachnospiraceae bacterium]|nr:formate/nitrite transporter family protein [Lachnospiraceae bacterium]
MDKSFYTPVEVVNNSIDGQVTKANLPLGKMILLGILAGAFIALGGAASNVAVHNISNVGLARTLAGAIFPVGLMLVVLVGGELFTGNCMMIMACMNKKIKASQMIRNLAVVYLSNFIGALFIDILVFYSGQFNYTDGMLGAYTIKVAIGKAGIAPGTAIASGILCNILVCLAILMAAASKDVTGKILAIFFPIWAFVVSGFEHCVANMFYIPAGMLAATSSQYVTKAEELYGITANQCSNLLSLGSASSLLYVTIGNILGGMVFIGILCYLSQKKEWK